MKKHLLFSFLFCFISINVQGEKSEEWKFNTHWQQVYDILRENKNISKAMDNRKKELTKNPDKFFRREIFIPNKELYSHNMSVFCVKKMMDLYNELYYGKINTTINENDEKLLIKTFLHNTSPMQSTVKDAVNLSVTGDSIFSFPNTFFIASEASFPGGETAALQYFSQKLRLPWKEAGRTIDFSLSVNKKGEISKPTITNNPTLIPDKEIIFAIMSMPTWQPAVSSVDGTNMNSVISFSIPLKEAVSLPTYPEGNDAAQRILEENLICPALNSNEKAIITLTIDENGNVTTPYQMKLSGNNYLCHIDSMPTWIPGKDESGRNVPTEIQMPINLKKLGVFPLFAKDSAEIQLRNHFNDFFTDRKELHNKICKINFVITKEGFIAEPITIETDSIHNKIPIQIPSSLEEEIKQRLLELPQWVTPAITTTGETISTLFSIQFGIEADKENKVYVSIDDITHWSNSNFKTKDLNLDEIDKKPEFPGGMEELMKFLRKQLNTAPSYLLETASIGTARTVVQFIVEKDGSISKPSILESGNPYLDRIAIRAVEAMPKWKPAKHNGIPIRTKWTLPVYIK